MPSHKDKHDTLYYGDMMHKLMRKIVVRNPDYLMKYLHCKSLAIQKGFNVNPSTGKKFKHKFERLKKISHASWLSNMLDKKNHLLTTLLYCVSNI